MGLKSRIGWYVHGGDQTAAALASLGTDLRELQQKVARIDDELQRHRGAGDVGAIQEEIEALRQQVRDVVDDLGNRVGVLTERLNSPS